MNPPEPPTQVRTYEDLRQEAETELFWSRLQNPQAFKTPPTGRHPAPSVSRKERERAEENATAFFGTIFCDPRAAGQLPSTMAHSVASACDDLRLDDGLCTAIRRAAWDSELHESTYDADLALEASNQLFTKIEVGETKLVLSGVTGRDSQPGHAVLYEITRADEGIYEISVFGSHADPPDRERELWVDFASARDLLGPGEPEDIIREFEAALQLPKGNELKARARSLLWRTDELRFRVKAEAIPAFHHVLAAGLEVDPVPNEAPTPKAELHARLASLLDEPDCQFLGSGELTPLQHLPNCTLHCWLLWIRVRQTQEVLSSVVERMEYNATHRLNYHRRVCKDEIRTASRNGMDDEEELDGPKKATVGRGLDPKAALDMAAALEIASVQDTQLRRLDGLREQNSGHLAKPRPTILHLLGSRSRRFTAL